MLKISPVSEKFAKNAYQRRLDSKLTRQQFCDKALISIETLKFIEHGVRLPTLEMAYKIACGLGTTIDELLK